MYNVNTRRRSFRCLQLFYVCVCQVIASLMKGLFLIDFTLHDSGGGAWRFRYIFSIAAKSFPGFNCEARVQCQCSQAQLLSYRVVSRCLFSHAQCSPKSFSRCTLRATVKKRPQNENLFTKWPRTSSKAKTKQASRQGAAASFLFFVTRIIVVLESDAIWNHVSFSWFLNVKSFWVWF